MFGEVLGTSLFISPFLTGDLFTNSTIIFRGNML